MKKCKYCQSEIDEKAKICPHCRKKQRHTNWNFVGIAFIALVITAIATGGLKEAIKSDNNPKENGKLEVINSKSTINALGVITAYGELINSTPKKMTNIKISYTCYTKDRQEIGKAEAKIEYINPNETLKYEATGTGKYTENHTCSYKITHSIFE